MKRVVHGLGDYPVVVATLVVAAIGGLLEWFGPPSAARWAISTFAVGLALWQVRGMLADLRAGTYGIDLLAVTAIGSAVAVGEYWAALVVCLMLSGGEALEDYAERRAGRELTGLLAGAPVVAHRRSADGGLVEIPVDDVAIGDELLVRPFEVLPVDGELLSEAASLDESSLTGEAMPVEHARGDLLLSGAVNGAEAMSIRATALAADSQYQQIVDLVRQAQASKAPVVRLADRVAVPFTAGALILAVAAWLISGDPTRLAEVLVVATPCPLIIAAPVAFMAGMSRSARAGIIVRTSAALEQLAAVRTAAFDKTGTLTHGEPRVVAVTAAPGFTAEEVLVLAAAVERFSAHPLAEAIVAHGAAEQLALPTVTDVTEVPAHGVRATAGHHDVVVGKAAFIAEVTGEHPPAHTDVATQVHVAVDGRYAGTLALADEIRPEAAATMASLHRSGLTTMMLTGDGEAVARHVAAEVGIDDVRAALLPQDKVAAVVAARRPVLMVGDGVNDAPVLAAADVGVAMGARGSSAASESADVVVLVDDVARAARAVQIGRRTMRVAWQAIGIGIGLSVLLMLVAAVGLLPAIVGAWLQEVVDLACIGWALLAGRPGRAERAELDRLAAATGETRPDRANGAAPVAGAVGRPSSKG